MAITYASGIIPVVGGYDSGTATSGTTTSLVNTGKSLATNAHAGRAIWIYEGTGAGQRRRIASNTTTTYIPNYAFTTAPDTTSKYLISYNETDILAADIAGAWGVFTKTGQQQYNCAAALQIGDGTNWSFFASYSTQYQFSTYKTTGQTVSGRAGWNGQVKPNALAVFGEQTSDEKVSQKGCSLYYDIAFPFVEFMSTSGNGQIDFLSGMVAGKSQGYFGSNGTTAGGKVKAYNSIFACDFTCYSTTVDPADLYNTTHSLDNIPNSIGVRANGTVSDVTVYNATLAVTGPGSNLLPLTLRNVKARGIPYAFTSGTGLVNAYFIDCDIPNFRIGNATGWTGVVYKQWSVKYTYGDITGARIAIINSSGVKFSELTSSGAMNEQIVSQGYLNAANKVNLVSYNPHELIVRKYGYKAIKRTVVLSEKIREYIEPELNNHLVADEATASGYAVTINGSAKTISTNVSAQNLYEYSQWWIPQSANVVYEEPIDSDGSTLRLTFGWAFTPGASFDYGSLRIAGGTIAFGTPGTITPRLGAITIRFTAAGTYAMGDADFGGAVTLTNTSGGAVTVELPAGVDYINTGPSITVVEPQIYQSVTLTGGIAGSRVQLYDTAASSELYNDIPASWPFTWTDSVPYAADRAIRLRVMAEPGETAYIFIDQAIGTATELSPSLSVLVSQQSDTVYNTNGIDGSTVTDVEIVDGTLRVQVSTGSITWQELYAYETYWLWTEEGIRDEGRFAFAPDVANYLWYDFKLKNTTSPSVPLVVSGGYGVDGDTLTSIAMIDSTGGTIIMAPDHVVVKFVDLAPGSSVITGDIAEVAAECQSALTSQGYTTTLATKLDTIDTLPTLAEIEASSVLAKETTVNGVANQVISAAQTTPIEANVKKVNDLVVIGSGTEIDPWGPE